MENSDIKSNRASVNWSFRENVARVLWAFVTPLFRLSPRPMWGFRRSILRLFGARVGTNAHVYPSVRIFIPWNLNIGEYSAIGDRVILYALGPIKIGDRATVSQGVHLCAGTHDWRSPEMPLEKRPITLGTGVWVAADAFVGPGVVVGAYAIVGARAVVMHEIRPNAIVVGNPARVLKIREPI